MTSITKPEQALAAYHAYLGIIFVYELAIHVQVALNMSYYVQVVYTYPYHIIV